MLKLLKIPTAEQLYQQACDYPKPGFEPCLVASLVDKRVTIVNGITTELWSAFASIYKREQ